jgi:outer membrane receptor protein involved in Fe transport
MVYFTWSEGYRPGGINRDPNLTNFGRQTFEPDFLTNYEVGFKSTWLDQRLRLNGAAYYSDWEDLQFTIFSFSFSSCCGNVFNLGDADILGVEADATFLVTDNWTLSAAFNYSDGETTDDFILPNAGATLAVPAGTELPSVPKFKGNVSTRHNFELGNLNAFAQLTYAYTGSRWNEFTSGRVNQPSYSILNFRAGIDQGSWGIDLFGNNLTNEVAVIATATRNSYEIGETTNRPLSFGAKYWVRF